MTELILGTAQYGPGYGITNEAKRLSDDAVATTLNAAVEGGVRRFDTADAYGDAQERVGRLMPMDADARYISKFALEGVPSDSALYGRAMRRLGVQELDGLLAHNARDFVDDRFPDALNIIRRAKLDGVVGLIGASVYDESELELAVKTIPDIDFVQVPASVVDRRLLDSSLLRRLRTRGVQVHARSAFLQGLLLAPAEKMTGRFMELRPIISYLDARARSLGVSRLALLLGFLKAHEGVDAVVVGATSRAELASILGAWEGSGSEVVEFSPGEVSLGVLDPRQW